MAKIGLSTDVYFQNSLVLVFQGGYDFQSKKERLFIQLIKRYLFIKNIIDRI